MVKLFYEISMNFVDIEENTVFITRIVIDSNKL